MSTLQERLERLKASFAEKAPQQALAVMTRAVDDLRSSGILDRLPDVGSPLPAFELQDTDGTTVRSAELLAKGPLVVTFYRGTW